MTKGSRDVEDREKAWGHHMTRGIEGEDRSYSEECASRLRGSARLQHERCNRCCNVLVVRAVKRLRVRTAG
jgi:hypothetical protein